MDRLASSITEVIESINLITDQLYHQNITEGYKALETTLLLLSDTMNNIYQYQTQENDLEIEEKKVLETLSNAMKSMEEKDTILLADILHYDLRESLEKILTIIK